MMSKINNTTISAKPAPAYPPDINTPPLIEEFIHFAFITRLNDKGTYT